jgi:hypothetical protein
MSAPLLSIVEGWSGALPFTLKADGAGIDLTGLTIAIVLRNSDGTLVKETTAGIALSTSLSTAGQLTYSPATSSGDLFLAVSSPYRVRFRVTDALAKSVYFPNDEYDLIEVNPK